MDGDELSRIDYGGSLFRGSLLAIIILILVLTLFLRRDIPEVIKTFINSLLK